MKKIIRKLAHKLEHLKFENLKKMFTRYGIPLLVIFIVWEIIEDILFPILFYYLGENVNAAFYSGIPLSLLFVFASYCSTYYSGEYTVLLQERNMKNHIYIEEYHGK